MTITNEMVNDVLAAITFLIYLKLTIEFMASLAPPPKRKKRKGGWWEDESRGK